MYANKAILMVKWLQKSSSIRKRQNWPKALILWTHRVTNKEEIGKTPLSVTFYVEVVIPTEFTSVPLGLNIYKKKKGQRTDASKVYGSGLSQIISQK